jgi:hypothetical protein
MKIHESIDNLKATLAQANDMLKLAEKSIDVSINALMEKATPEQLPTIQKQLIDIKRLMIKAKSGENVDAEITIISKTIKDGR